MRHIILATLLTLAFTSCKTTYESVIKNKDVQYKLKMANEFYEKGQYFDASRVYESIMPVYRATEYYEDIYYKFAYSFYYDKDYLNAAYQFKNFTEFFKRSERLEEMQFMQAVSTYKDSRKISLDQTETEKAIGQLQTFLGMYPQSKYSDEALELLDSAIVKLEMKAAYGAQQYYNLDDYRSASVAYKTLIFDYPDSKNLDYYYFMVVKSLTKYAGMSKSTVQRERYVDASNYYDLMKTYYPNSQYLGEADKLNKQAQAKIKELNK